MANAVAGQNAAFGTTAAFDVEHFIALDQQSIRIQFGLGIALLAVGTFGVLGAFAGLVQPGGASLGFVNFDAISKAVGLVIDLAGLFPFNNCWSRWERIRTLRAITLNPAALDAETRNDL